MTDHALPLPELGGRVLDLTRDADRVMAILIAAHGPAIWRLTGSYERNPAEREDLYQDIWIAIWKALPAFRGEAQLRTYLFRIAHNRGLTHRGRARPRLATIEEAESVADPAAERDPHQDLRAALGRLPSLYRETVSLRLEGLATREIAAVLGISESNVGVRLLRARALLRALLREDP